MVTRTCCVVGCKTSSEEDTLFFKVPTVRSLLRRWTDVIRPPTTITVDSYICNAHFLTTDYESVRGKTRLKRRVVPSIFDNGETMKTSKLKDDTSAALTTEISSLPTAVNIDDTQVTGTEVPNAEVTHTEVPQTGLTERIDTEVSNTRLTELTDTEVPNTRVTENMETEVPNTRVTGDTNAATSNTELIERIDREDPNTRGTENMVTEIPNGSVTEITDAETPPNKKLTKFIEIEISNIGIKDHTLDTTIKTKKIEDNLGKESLKAVEVSSQNSRTSSSAKAEEDDAVMLDDQTGALTNSAGDDIPVPCAESLDERPTILDKCNNVAPKAISPVPDMNKDDIEEILTNYHIKQTKPLHETYEKIFPEKEEVVDLANVKETQPVFIEISVDKDRRADTSAGDCLMLLESVQVDIDPSSLMLPERIIEEVDGVIGDDDDDDDDDVVVEETTIKKDDPISLLTSSDEDDVILEEPDIDTVEVSDETDEDDVPLGRLLSSGRAGADGGDTGGPVSNLGGVFWGVCDYYCVECHFKTYSRSEYQNHVKQHSTVLQVCQLCGYTTASEAQFSRHKKKHKEERKFKCHLCDYKARHNMSLIYHLRTHNLKTRKGFSKCVCGFKSSDTTKIAKHLKVCTKRYTCDKCSYATKRRSDLKRHSMRKHSDADDEYTPSWD